MNNAPVETAALREALPGRKDDIARLARLTAVGQPLRVVAYGKYNHGKSSLLNALAGQDYFEVGDIRTTVKVDQVNAGGIAWIDTPGLDAAVGRQDDELARSAAYQAADVVLFCHNAGEGELDAQEQAALQALREAGRGPNTILLVLLQKEQVTAEELALIRERCTVSQPALRQFAVSAAQYRSAKPALAGKSGCPELMQYLNDAQACVADRRHAEARRLRESLERALAERRAANAAARSDIETAVRRTEAIMAEVQRISADLQKKLKEA
jgi:GTPase